VEKWPGENPYNPATSAGADQFLRLDEYPYVPHAFQSLSAGLLTSRFGGQYETVVLLRPFCAILYSQHHFAFHNEVRNINEKRVH
jgi:hypothetical protein